MKRKISLFLACVLIAAFSAGCNSSKKSDSTSSDTSSVSEVSSEQNGDASAEGSVNSDAASKTESSANGDTASKPESSANDDAASKPESSANGDTASKPESSANDDTASKAESTDTAEGSEGELSVITIDEDGNLELDLDDISDWSDWEEASDDTDVPAEPEDTNDTLSQLSYQMIYLEPNASFSGVKLPAYYTISSAKELEKFTSDYKSTFSLDKEYTADSYINKTSFVNETKYMNDEFFKDSDICIVVASYKKGTGCDLGQISENDGTIVIDLCLELPSSNDAASYVCFMIPSPKDTFSSKNITTNISSFNYEE